MKNEIVKLINSGVVKGFAYVEGNTYIAVGQNEKLTGNARSLRTEEENVSDWMISNLPNSLLVCEFVIYFI